MHRWQKANVALGLAVRYIDVFAALGSSHPDKVVSVRVKFCLGTSGQVLGEVRGQGRLYQRSSGAESMMTYWEFSS